MRQRLTKRRAVRLGIALILFLALLVVQHARNRTDMLSIKWGNRELMFASSPSALGFVNWAEVYMDQWVEFRSMGYRGNPFDPVGGGPDQLPAPMVGHFYFYHYHGGGPHWTVSIAVPIWMSGIGVVPLLAMLLPRRASAQTPEGG